MDRKPVFQNVMRNGEDVYSYEPFASAVYVELGGRNSFGDYTVWDNENAYEYWKSVESRKSKKAENEKSSIRPEVADARIALFGLDLNAKELYLLLNQVYLNTQNSKDTEVVDCLEGWARTLTSIAAHKKEQK